MSDTVRRLRHLAEDYAQNEMADAEWMDEGANRIEELEVALREWASDDALDELGITR